MKNPILHTRSYKIYVLVWLAIAMIHTAVLYYYYEFSFSIAVADSLAYNLLFASIGPSIWYVVAFASLSKDDISLLGTHLGAAALTVLLWVTLAGLLLQWIFRNQPDYLVFLNEAFAWRVVVGVLYYSIMVLIFYLIKYYLDMQKRMNRELELQNLLKDTELKMLKSQINPHFIFNSLNSISALTLTKPEMAQEMVIKLSDFLRYSLGKNNEEMNTLEQEIENVSLYLDIERIRFGNRLIFEKKVLPTCKSVKVPNLILQPLFENAIKYGVYDSTDRVNIRLDCQAEEGGLNISVMNSFDPESVTSRGEGIGLQHVKQRLALVYGRSDLVTVEEKDKEFSVHLTIPSNKQHDE